jgi:DNA helicase-2/ATP-dependent DNA helicase PcrA
VQGAAGSGKTTIALHRIAYLIYTFEKTFYPENFMILAPNRLFLNYISEVLPELGVEKVKQTTFEDFAMEIIGKKYKIVDPGQKLTDFVNNRSTKEDIERNRLVAEESDFKSSMLFKEILDDYASIIESDFIPHENFSILSYTLFKYEEINSLFMNEYKNLPMVKRIQEIKKHLTNRLKLKKDYLIEKLQYDCDRRIKMLKETMEDSPERHALIVEAIDTKNETTAKMQVMSKKVVQEYISRISRIDPFKYYSDLMKDRELLRSLVKGRIDDSILDFIMDYTADILKTGSVEIEDLAPIMYLKHLIYGLDEKLPVRHIVVDEAQDFSMFQFYVLKNIVKDSSFTILGDMAQGIHSYRGTRNWKRMMKYVFPDGQCEYLNLEQSYRTTVEIMEAANKVIAKLKDENLIPAKPVFRHGDKVAVIKKESKEEIAKDIIERVRQLKKEGFKTAAVIGKTLDECARFAALLKKGKEGFTLITGKEKEYKGGMVIVPSYLAKGLEFDAVFIPDGGSEEYSEDELDIKLLYVAMTRPLHKLCIYHTEKMSPLLEEV